MNWITLTRDIKGVLYGDNITRPQGHWVLLRWYRVGEYSKFWDPKAGVAIGGPKWKYWDIPVKTSYQILTTSGMGSGPLGALTPPSGGFPGQVDNVQRLYIFEKCRKPKEQDVILEYENCLIVDDANIFIEHAKVNIATPFRIQHVEHIRVDDNKQKYYLCWAYRDNRRL